MKPKYIFTVALSLLLFTNAFAQTDSSEIKKEKRIVIIKKTHDSDSIQRDTIEINLDNDVDIEFGDDEKMVFEPQAIINEGALNFGFAGLMRGSNPVGNEFPELSNGKSLHIGLEQSWGFNLIAHKVRFWTGIRYDIQNYRFNNPNVRLSASQPNFAYTLDSVNNSSKSKLVVNYIGVPLAIGYNSNENSADEGFWIRAGVNAGYRVRAHSKVKTESGNKDKLFDDFNTNNFAVSPFVYLGYNSVGIYARMTTTPFFNENQGAAANAFQFGIVIM
jgi:Outer membrane protein beta-barrel domain